MVHFEQWQKVLLKMPTVSQYFFQFFIGLFFLAQIKKPLEQNLKFSGTMPSSYDLFPLYFHIQNM